eukprot:scaffold655453_cov67-Prasinocladus_malaysianus.AAC.1
MDGANVDRSASRLLCQQRSIIRLAGPQMGHTNIEAFMAYFAKADTIPTHVWYTNGQRMTKFSRNLNLVPGLLQHQWDQQAPANT